MIIVSSHAVSVVITGRGACEQPAHTLYERAADQSAPLECNIWAIICRSRVSAAPPLGPVARQPVSPSVRQPARPPAPTATR